SDNVVTNDGSSEPAPPAAADRAEAAPPEHVHRGRHRRRLHAVEHCRPCRPGADEGADPVASESLSYRRSERTAIYVRTQEGDTVRLKIKLRESVQADATQAERGDEGATELRLAARTSAKIAVSVDGNLSEAEQAAIASVLDQATDLADEFFA